MESKTEKKKKSLSGGVWLALIIVTIGVCVLLVRYWKDLGHFQILIYLGLFFTAILAGSPIPIPTPCMVLTFTLGSQFQPVVIGLIAGLGAAIGSMLVYFAAYTGRRFLPSLDISDQANRIYSSSVGKFLQRIKLPRLVEFVNRRGIVGVFLFSIFPNPFLMPLLITTGINRLRAWKVGIACLLGHYGLGSLLKYFGVPAPS